MLKFPHRPVKHDYASEPISPTVEQFSPFEIRLTSARQSEFLIKRRRRLLRLVALTQGLLALFVCGFSVYSWISSGNAGFSRSFLSAFLWLLGCGVAYWLAYKSNRGLLQVGAYLILGVQSLGTFGALFFNSLGTSPTPVLYILLVLIAALLLSAKELLGWTFATITMLTINYVLMTFFIKKVGDKAVDVVEATTAYIFFGAAILVCGVGLYYFVTSFIRAVNEAEARLISLVQISADREKKQQLGLEMCQNVNISSLQLAQTSQEQSLTNGELAGTVARVVSGMTEFNHSTALIAQTAEAVNDNIKLVAESGNQLGLVVNQARQTSQEGRQIVLQTLSAINQVNDSIISLEQRLEDLSMNTGQVNRIINLINNIANETHLLALNAAIESAGAGEHGTRFAVVASEVKSLSNRILQASREVRSVIGSARQAITEAAQAAKEGAAQTRATVQVAAQSGEVIEALQTIINRTEEEARTVSHRREAIQLLIQNIAGATRQQQEAGQQILFFLEQISHTSYQTVSAIQQISAEAADLQQLSSRLTEALVA